MENSLFQPEESGAVDDTGVEGFHDQVELCGSMLRRIRFDQTRGAGEKGKPKTTSVSVCVRPPPAMHHR